MHQHKRQEKENRKGMPFSLVVDVKKGKQVCGKQPQACKTIRILKVMLVVVLR